MECLKKLGIKQHPLETCILGTFHISRLQKIMISASMETNQKSFHKSALMAWVACVVIGLWVFHEIAEKEFTAVLTLSVMVQALAFILLQMQISNSRSVAGISGKALTMHAIKLCCRLGSSLFLDGYLPTDQSGDWIYQLGDVLSLFMVLQILYSIYGAHKASYQFEADTLDIRNIIMGAVVLAVLIHPDMNSWTFFDVLWTTHLYVDAVAMVPQLWMISQMGGQVKGFTAHYMAATMLGNFLSALFWFFATPDLVEDENSFNIAGLAINGAHAVQMVLLLDFGYYYGKAFMQGRGLAATMQIGQKVVDV